MPGLFATSGLWKFDPVRESESNCSLMPDHAGDQQGPELHEPAGRQVKIPEGRPQPVLFSKFTGAHPTIEDPQEPASQPMLRQPVSRPATGERDLLSTSYPTTQLS